MKTRYIAIIGIIIMLVILVLSTGGKISGIMILDYSTSEDGCKMTLRVGVASSIGYTRAMKSKDVGDEKRITFYSTYGFNSSLGAKREFQLDLAPNINEIYFDSGNGEFKLMLQKDEETNQWYRVKN